MPATGSCRPSTSATVKPSRAGSSATIRSRSTARTSGASAATTRPRRSGRRRPDVEQLLDDVGGDHRDAAVEDSTLTRGGPLMERPQGWLTTVSLGNRVDVADAVVGRPRRRRQRRRRHDAARRAARFSFRPGPRWELSVAPFYEQLVEPQQYVATMPAGAPRPSAAATSSRSSTAARSPPPTASGSRSGPT